MRLVKARVIIQANVEMYRSLDSFFRCASCQKKKKKRANRPCLSLENIQGGDLDFDQGSCLVTNYTLMNHQ